MNEKKKKNRISPGLEFSNIYHSDTEIGFLTGWLSKVLDGPPAHLLESQNWITVGFSVESAEKLGEKTDQKKSREKKDEEKIKRNQKIEKQIEREN